MRRTLVASLGSLAQAVLVAAAMAQPCTQAPPAPTGVQASQLTNSCSVQVQWNGVAGADSYEVWMGPSTGDFGAAVLVGTPTSTGFLDSRPLSNQVRSYWVKAVNACGVSPVSGFAQGWATPGSPYTPVSLSATPMCDGRIRVRWAANATPTGTQCMARVWRTTTPEFVNFRQVSPTSFFGLELYDNTIVPGTAYWYWVQVYRQPCDGPVVGGVPAMVDPVQQPPLSVSATYRSMCSAIRVAWVASCQSSYTLYRSTVNDPATATVVATQTASVFLDTLVTPLVPYYYWVSATGPRGQSVLTGPASGEGGVIPPTVGHIEDQDTRIGDTVTFYAYAISDPPGVSWQWFSEGELLDDSDHYSGATTGLLTIHDITPADARTYYAVATNACGPVATNAARLNVGEFPRCPEFIGDYNSDGGVDGSDIESFFIDWEQGAYCADVNRDGGVDGQDVETFITCWESC